VEGWCAGDVDLHRLAAADQIGHPWMKIADLVLEDIVALAIEDLGAEPLHEDWEPLLRETRSH
jgi:hypothetical protein